MPDVPGDPAVELLYQHLGALPDPDFGAINLLPFAVDSEQTNGLKRKVCQAVVALFRNDGYPMDRDAVPVEPSRTVALNCRQCSTTLLSVQVGEHGIANLAAANMLTGLAALNRECPHNVLTPDDQRRLIEQAVLASQQ